MNAKRYLIQYRAIRSKLRSIEILIKELRKEIAGLDEVSISSPWPDGQPHGTGTTDPTGNQAAKAADLMPEEYRKKLRGQLEDMEIRELKARSKMWERRLEIEETLSMLTDPTYYDVLHMKYIEGATFEMIAVQMHYSYRHVTRLHGEALLEVEKILKN